MVMRLSRRQRAAKIACVATLAQVMRKLKNRRNKSPEIHRVECFATKSRTLSKFVAKCSDHCALAKRQFSKKLHHHRKQKIARVASALQIAAQEDRIYPPAWTENQCGESERHVIPLLAKRVARVA